jgi:uncharacterized membrane protein YkvA (DUF1232 family)
MNDEPAGGMEVETPGPPMPGVDQTMATSEAAEPPLPGDPFPRDAWATLTSHAAGYLRLTLALLRDPAVSKHRRAALLAAAAYFASPIDLIPGIVPVLGQVDDLAVSMLAIRLALNALEPARRQLHLAAAGLSDEALHEDSGGRKRLLGGPRRVSDGIARSWGPPDDQSAGRAAACRRPAAAGSSWTRDPRADQGRRAPAAAGQ